MESWMVFSVASFALPVSASGREALINGPILIRNGQVGCRINLNPTFYFQLLSTKIAIAMDVDNIILRNFIPDAHFHLSLQALLAERGIFQVPDRKQRDFALLNGLVG